MGQKLIWILFEFKGFGESRLIQEEDDFYTGSSIQKSLIVKDFLSLVVSNRKW